MSGEKEFIRRLQSEVLGRTDLGWRDDCVITDIAPDLSLLYSMDRPELIFGRDTAAMRLNGRWAAAVVANDVIACGQRPRGISFDIGAATCDSDGLLEWARGVVDLCDAYGMTYEGGNVGAGTSITGVSWGLGEPRSIIRREGARAGDVIVVTAAVGTGWAMRVWAAHRPQESERLAEFASYKHWPAIRLDAFERVWKLRCIHAGMDLTDGLVEFAYELIERSNVGVELTLPEHLPAGLEFVAHDLGLPVQAFFLEPGYDTPFAHAWAVDPVAVPEVLGILRESGVQYTVVGRTFDAPRDIRVLMPDGRVLTPPRYWDDILNHRGSVRVWEDCILSLF